MRAVVEEYLQANAGSTTAPMEVDAILMAPLWFARKAGLEAPNLEAVVSIAAHKARGRGLY